MQNAGRRLASTSACVGRRDLRGAVSGRRLKRLKRARAACQEHEREARWGARGYRQMALVGSRGGRAEHCRPCPCKSRPCRGALLACAPHHAPQGARPPTPAPRPTRPAPGAHPAGGVTRDLLLLLPSDVHILQALPLDQQLPLAAHRAAARHKRRAQERRRGRGQGSASERARCAAGPWRAWQGSGAPLLRLLQASLHTRAPSHKSTALHAQARLPAHAPPHACAPLLAPAAICPTWR